MPAIIDSAPDCIVHKEGANRRRLGRLHLQAATPECQGIMTFGPGSTYGEDGVGGGDRLHDPDLDRHRRHGGRLRRVVWYENTG